MKRKTAKELLAESFRELAESKSIDKITVSDIVSNCGYSTATFYRHFKDKYDLIAWDYTRDLEIILEQVDRNKTFWKKTLSDASDYYAKRKDYIGNLILHTTGHDSFVRYMTEINYAHLKKMILAVSGTECLSEKTEMYVRIYCLGTVHLTCEWILGKYPVNKAVLQEVYEESLPKPLQEFVC